MANTQTAKTELAGEGSQNPLLAIRIQRQEFPDEITTDWRRFSSGLWRIPEGDISKAYSGDSFPQLKVFVEAGQLFTNLGMEFFDGSVEANCYPLLPLRHDKAEKIPYSAEGSVGIFKSQSWSLGPKVAFVADDPPIAVWRQLLRVQYCDGGHFARQTNYLDFLNSITKPKTVNQTKALCLEQKGEFLTFSKAEMAKYLDDPAKSNESGKEQLSLF